MEWLNSFTRFMGGLTVGWVDFVTLLVVCIGIVRGRKRGLSEELLDTVMWLIIIVAGAFLYRIMGNLLIQKPIFSLLTYYIMSYIAIALVVKIVFVLIKKKFGQKMVESDMFGRMEFYGGMVAGSVRFLCMYLFALSLLHAPHYSEEYLANRAKEVDYNYGSDFFPHPCKIQASVFQNSFTGKNTEKYLAVLLIEQTDGSSRSVRDDTSLAKRNERKIDAIMGGR
jgi:uncharacterized membrane protein required for colicin V production